MSHSSSLNEPSSLNERSSSNEPQSTAEQFYVEGEENSTSSSSNHQSYSDIEAPPFNTLDVTSSQTNSIALEKSVPNDAAILNDSSVLHNAPSELKREKSVILLINLFLHMKFCQFSNCYGVH